MRNVMFAGALVLPAVLVGALLAGCQPGGVVAAPQTPVAATSAAAPTGTPAGTAASSAAAAAGVAGCTLASLSVTAGAPDASAGHRREVLVFTNTGTVPCTIRGYPGVAALDAGSAQVAQARRTVHGYEGGLSSGSAPPLVTLRPGGSASSIVEALAAGADGASCVAWSGLLVTAPDDTRSTRLPWDSDGCADLQVHPVVPGTGGSLR